MDGLGGRTAEREQEAAVAVTIASLVVSDSTKRLDTFHGKLDRSGDDGGGDDDEMASL